MVDLALNEERQRASRVQTRRTGVRHTISCTSSAPVVRSSLPLRTDVVRRDKISRRRRNRSKSNCARDNRRSDVESERIGRAGGVAPKLHDATAADVRPPVFSTPRPSLPKRLTPLMAAERPAICVLLRRLTEGRTWRRKATVQQSTQGTNAAKSADRPAEALSISPSTFMDAGAVGSSGIEGGPGGLGEGGSGSGGGGDQGLGLCIGGGDDGAGGGAGKGGDGGGGGELGL